MKPENEKNGKLATYATIMLLTAIIIIIIAAMADNREQKFKSEIDSTAQTNMSIQEEIVKIKDENYNLSREVERLEKSLSESIAKNEACAKISEALALCEEGDADAASEMLAEVDAGALDKSLSRIYDMVSSAIAAASSN